MIKLSEKPIKKCPDCRAWMFEELGEGGDYHPDSFKVHQFKYLACSACDYTESLFSRKSREKHFDASRMQFTDYADIIDRYLGKERTVVRGNKEMKLRRYRFCDISYQDSIDCTIDIARREIELSEDELDLGEVAGYWADVMGDWVSESNLEPKI